MTRVELPYADRDEAGRLLAEVLRERLAAAGTGLDGIVVLGIPRGGVVVAAVIARLLGAPLDVVVARKIGAPGEPELAVGAATADGTILIEPWAGQVGADESYLAVAAERQAEAARAREAILRSGRPRIPLAGSVAIVVDDGVATGATMHAALLAVRAAGAIRTIAAAPVGAPSSVGRLLPFADEVVVPALPLDFAAVGTAYRRFDQTDDSRVIALLAAADRDRRSR